MILGAGGVTLLCGILALIFARGDNQGRGVLGIFRMLLTITAALGLFQAIVGGLMLTQNKMPGDNLHFVYGGIVLLAIPVAYVYSDQNRVRRDIIIMVIAAVAVIGAAVRAMMTG